MTPRAAAFLSAPSILLGLFGLAGGCSVVFSTDDLSRGGGGSSGAGGSTGSPCTSVEQCDDGDECTLDRCDNGHCNNPPKAEGTVCKAANDCNDKSLCDGHGHCLAGATHPSNCSTDEVCIGLPCTPDGCTRAPNKTPCEEAQACGQCIDGACTQAPDTDVCLGGDARCGGATDLYLIGFSCTPACPGGGSDMCMTTCVNTGLCRTACRASFKACCDLSATPCTEPCPTNYQIQPGSQKSDPTCGCGAGNSVICTRM